MSIPRVHPSRAPNPLARRLLAGLVGLGAALPAAAAESSFVDTVADVMAVIVLIVVPAVVIVLFWVVHVLPEKIAHKRHHPQTAAITTLCLLSLVFGGLLWPLAWLWASTKPIGYRMAYGTDKSPEYYDKMAEQHRAGEVIGADLLTLKHDLTAMAARGALPARLQKLKAQLDQIDDEELHAQADAAAAAAAAPVAEPKGSA